MNLRQIFTLSILLTIVLRGIVFAQEVDIPDLSLRAVVRDTLNLPAGTAITEADMLQLTSLNAKNRQITELAGLEYATNLTELYLGENPITDISPLTHLTQLTLLRLNDVWGISDISALAHLTQLHVLHLDRNLIGDINPLAGLTKLEELDLRYNRIIDVSPLANLTQLNVLLLNNNRIGDVSPLANLTQLTRLFLDNNQIEDVRSLANLTQLDVLHIQWNRVTDHSPLDGLSLTDFRYDQTCDMPSLPFALRIKNRTYPSIFARWGPRNPELHDLWFDALPHGLRFQETSHGAAIVGSVNRAIRLRDEYLATNPNMVFLISIQMREYQAGAFPQDWPYWIRDTNGNVVSHWPGYNLIDFTHPYIQDRIVQQAIAVSKCGLFDGIFFDWWHESAQVLGGFRTLEAEQRTRDNILQRIRANTRPNFLIMGNTNQRIIPRTAPHINGGFMETGIPDIKTGADLESAINRAEDSLFWLEHNLREPRINGLEGFSLPGEPFHSPNNRRWMRMLTTLSLTHSDGYVLYTPTVASDHTWHDFWDADLGRPVGEKRKLYQETEGLYIREFTNGWAVYNHSGETQTITLPEEVQGVASELVDTEHTLPNLDGEMYLRVNPANPADVNGDGAVNILDLVMVAQGLGKDNPDADVNRDGVVNVFDLVQVAGAFGGGGAAPSAYSLDPTIISATDVEKWLALAGGLGIADANFQRGIRFLEGLLAALTPKETTLLPNYPNPFNPETWIPYHLAREAEVSITIYDTKGTPVRRLALGNQAVGYYAERGKAAYWDGRNEDGEAVASGIYIYQFRAGDYAASRRMVIAK